MADEHVLLEREGDIAILTINRPSVLNALDSATIDDLRRAVLDIRGDAAIRCAIVTGAGEKSFVAGADIGELAAQTPSGGREHALRGQQVFELIETMGKPVIAAINGFALGGGCELAMACTLRIAAETAQLGQPEISLGIMPGFAGTQRLTRLVGRGRALEIVLTGRRISAQEALSIGLVNRVVPAGDLMSEAKKLAHQLAASAPVALHYIIDAVTQGADMAFADACRYEATLFGLVASTSDMREGTRAFLEKRKPIFKGE